MNDTLRTLAERFPDKIHLILLEADLISSDQDTEGLEVLLSGPPRTEGNRIFWEPIDLTSDDIQLIANTCGYVIYAHCSTGKWNYELNHYPIPLVSPEFDVYAGKSVSEILAMPSDFPDMLSAMKAGLDKIAEIVKGETT